MDINTIVCFGEKHPSHYVFHWTHKPSKTNQPLQLHTDNMYPPGLKALCNEFFDGEIFELRYSVLCTGSKDANRFPKLQVALFL